MMTMENVYLGYAILILITVAGGMVGVIRNPTRADKMLAALLMGTAGVALLILLAVAFETPAFVDVALVFALLALVVTVAFVKTAWSASSEKDHHNGS